MNYHSSGLGPIGSLSVISMFHERHEDTVKRFLLNQLMQVLLVL